MERYARQIAMPEIGQAGQKRLAQSRVLVVGAGGLGSPVLLYLAAAGVGTLGVLDADRVSMSNLNRQIVYTESDLGKLKVSAASERLEALHSGVRVIRHHIHLNADNVGMILSDYDVIVDCVDSLATRHVVNRAALEQDKIVIEGGIEGFHGFVLSVKRGEACIACMHPGHGPSGGIPVFGTTAGVTGSLQATECVKVLLGRGEPLYSRVLLFDLYRMEFDELPLIPTPACPICGFFQRTR